MNELGLGRESPWDETTTLEKLTRALQARGFGILATLRVHEILKEKTGTEIPPLIILDVCAPRFALRALTVDRGSALVLPCKIVLAREQGRLTVVLQRPTVVLDRLYPEPALRELGTEVEQELVAAIEAATGPASGAVRVG
ncbi:MAG: DUF302 domain-containing protein [Thermoplasmata archaeon]